MGDAPRTSALQEYKLLYMTMFSALQKGDLEQANHYRIKMEDVRLASAKRPNFDLTRLPPFAQLTVDKNHFDLKIDAPSNCINAAMNFHSDEHGFEPQSPMQLLAWLRDEFAQIETQSIEPSLLQMGDVVGFWSRNGDAWKNQTVRLAELDPSSPGFPFGMVFDHVAIFVGCELLFHKPDPTRESRYQLSFWNDVIPYYEMLPGFELTIHRREIPTAAPRNSSPEEFGAPLRENAAGTF